MQVTFELDVIATEHEEIAHEGPQVKPVDVTNILRGRLHFRMANVGMKSEVRSRKGLKIFHGL